MVAAGRLPLEVLERVGMLEIRVSPLRERLGDLREMGLAMLGRLGCAGAQVDWQRLEQYGWPGNLAELWQVLQGFAADGGAAAGAAGG